MPPTHFIPGLLAVKSRLTRSGREPRARGRDGGADLSAGLCGHQALLTHGRVRTVSRSTHPRPRGRRAAVMRRYPQVPSEAPSSVLMKRVSLRLLVVVADSGLLRQL